MTGGPSQTPPDRTRASASASRRRRRQAGHRTLADAGQPDKNARPLPAGRSQRPGRVQPVHRGPVTLWAPSGAAKDQGGGAPPPERQRACAAGLRPRLGVSSRPSRPPHRWETSAAQSSRGSGLPVMQRVGPVFRGLPHRSWSRPHPASHSPEFGGSHLGGGGPVRRFAACVSWPGPSGAWRGERKLRDDFSCAVRRGSFALALLCVGSDSCAQGSCFGDQCNFLLPKALPL